MLGVILYCRCFLPDLCKRLRPINRLLKSNACFALTPDIIVLFCATLSELSTPPVLAFPKKGADINTSCEFRLRYNHSRESFGAALEQPRPDVSIRPITFVSRANLDNERHWSFLEREAGAFVWAIKGLLLYRYQIPLVYSDHKALEYPAQVSEYRAHVQIWLALWTDYPSTVEFCRGSTMLTHISFPAFPNRRPTPTGRAPFSLLTPPTYTRTLWPRLV